MKIQKTKKLLKDIWILASFTDAFCRENHKFSEKETLNLKGNLGNILNGYNYILCKDCKNTLLYGCVKRLLCPYDPKPACKRCPTPCYRKGYKEKMKEIMKFSGFYFIKKGKIEYILKYFS